MSLRDMANDEADRIENDDSLTDDEKRRYLRDIAEELDEAEREYERDDYDYLSHR